MRIKEEYIRNAAENIARCYEKEAAIGERARASFAELARFAAQRRQVIYASANFFRRARR